MLNSVNSFQGSLSLRIPPLILHVGLHRPPQRSNVSLAKTCRPSSLYQLEEEGVLCKDGLGEHLEKVPGKRGHQGKDTCSVLDEPSHISDSLCSPSFHC